MIGKTISHYRIIEKIGEGGMGVVYKARDLKLERFVALKFLPVHMGRDENQKQRFINEAKAVSTLDHPNICTVYEISEIPTSDNLDDMSRGQLFIAMAFYEGQTLEERMSKGIPIDVNEAINIVFQIAQGLQRAHEKDIVHRDIKPANIILPLDADIKIVDFGLAKLKGQPKLTQQESTLGTISYMSPEQAEGSELDMCTDIWSLGIIFYELLTGRSPFAADYDQAVVYNILNSPLPSIKEQNRQVPADLEQVILKCLEKNREARYQSVGDFMADLLEIVRKNNYVIKTRAGEVQLSQSKQKTAFQKKPRLAIAAALILLITLTILMLWNNSDLSLYERAYFSKNYQEAAEYSDDERSPTNIKANRYFLLSVAKSNQNTLPDHIKQEYRDILSDNPDSAPANYLLGLAYFTSPENRQERDSVWVLYNRAEQIGLQDIYLKLDQLIFYMANGYNQQATELANQLQIRNPDNPEIMFELGYLYYTIADTNKSKIYYEKSIDLYENFVSSHIGLARLAMKNNDKHTAEYHLDKANAINPENILVVKERTKFFLRQGNYNAAETYLRSLIDQYEHKNAMYYKLLADL
jgi:serine/threonine protein kinase